MNKNQDNIQKQIENLKTINKLSLINYAKREYNKGIVFNILIKKYFYTKGNGVWYYYDTNFPFHIEFSHWKHLNSVRIYDNKLINFIEFKYSKKQWVNSFLNKLDQLLDEFRKNDTLKKIYDYTKILIQEQKSVPPEFEIIFRKNFRNLLA